MCVCMSHCGDVTSALRHHKYHLTWLLVQRFIQAYKNPLHRWPFVESIGIQMQGTHIIFRCMDLLPIFRYPWTICGGMRCCCMKNLSTINDQVGPFWQDTLELCWEHDKVIISIAPHWVSIISHTLNSKEFYLDCLSIRIWKINHIEPTIMGCDGLSMFQSPTNFLSKTFFGSTSKTVNINFELILRPLWEL